MKLWGTSKPSVLWSVTMNAPCSLPATDMKVAVVVGHHVHRA